MNRRERNPKRMSISPAYRIKHPGAVLLGQSCRAGCPVLLGGQNDNLDGTELVPSCDQRGSELVCLIFRVPVKLNDDIRPGLGVQNPAVAWLKPTKEFQPNGDVFDISAVGTQRISRGVGRPALDILEQLFTPPNRHFRVY